MSMLRYTCAESMTTISTGKRSASAIAAADLPLAVGPRRAKTLPAACDVEDGAADVGGLLGGKPEDGAGDFLGFAGAAERRGGADALGAAGLAARGVDLGLDHARAHRVDADAFGADFLRQSQGED